jgi:hypothetical protein
VAPLATISGGTSPLTSPYGVALSPTGDLYVTNELTNSINEYDPVPGGFALLSAIDAAGLVDPHGIAVDPAGNVFVADLFANSMTEYTPAGQHNLALAATITGAVSGPYDVTVQPPTPPHPPALYVSPVAGTAGTRLTITGQYFPPGKAIVIHLDSAKGTRLAATTVGSAGKISLAVKVPATTYGAHQAIAVGATGTLAHASFKVLAAMDLSPATVARDAVVHVTLTGFRADQAIAIRLSSVKGTVLTHVKASASGQVKVTFKATMRPGKYRIYATTSAGPQGSATLVVKAS